MPKKSTLLPMRWICLTGLFAFVLFWNPLLAENKSDWSELVLFRDPMRFDIQYLSPLLSDEEKELVLKAAELKKNEFIIIHKRGQEYLLQVNCTLNFWRWKGDFWEKQLGNEEVGIYCESKFIFEEDEVFLLGGGGFWNINSDYIKLNSELAKPEFIPTENQPIDYRSSMAFRLKNGVLVWDGVKHNARLSKKIELPGNKFLDIKNLKWKEVSIKGLPKNIQITGQDDNYVVLTVDFPDYGFFFYIKIGEDTKEFIIIDKSTLEIRRGQHTFGNLDEIEFYLIGSENNVHIKLVENNLMLNFKMEDYLSTTEVIGKLEIESSDFSIPKIPTWELWLDGFLLLLIAFIGYQKWSTKSLEESVENSDPVAILIDELFYPFVRFQGLIITILQMDELLGLDQEPNMDSKKGKRAKKIKQINTKFESEYGYPLIERVKNEEDKRVVNYRIAKIDFSQQN